MSWKLIKVKHTDWIQDNSGYYTLIHYIKENCCECDKACIDCIDGHVRLDVMTIDDVPVVSFQGKAEDVRKRSMRYLETMQQWTDNQSISFEHIAYIGAELARCELLGADYVQD